MRWQKAPSRIQLFVSWPPMPEPTPAPPTPPPLPEKEIPVDDRETQWIGGVPEEMIPLEPLLEPLPKPQSPASEAPEPETDSNDAL